MEMVAAERSGATVIGDITAALAEAVPVDSDTQRVEMAGPAVSEVVEEAVQWTLCPVKRV